MKRSVLAIGLLLMLGGAIGCGSSGGGGDVPQAGMERCELCGKDVKAGELKMKGDNKVCEECFAKEG